MQPELKPLNIASLTPPLSVTRIESLSGLLKLEDFFKRTRETTKQLGWDIETTPLKDYFFRRCRTIQFGNLNEQYVIDLLPFFHDDPDQLFQAQGHYGTKLPNLAKEMLQFLEPILVTNEVTKVGVQLSFEYQMFYWLFGMRTYGFYDCAMAEKCIWAGASSLKNYGYFSMNSMMERYFHQTVDKQYQESFTLDGELSQGQVDYAALDTRLPLAIKAVQQIIASGQTLAMLKAKKSPIVKYLEHLTPVVKGTGEPIVLGNNLQEIIQIENDAIGAFEDMHIHGELLDRPKWLARIAGKKIKLKALFSDVLDPYFIPLVGSKHAASTDAEIDAAEIQWKNFNIVSDAELKIKGEMHKVKKSDPIAWAALEAQRAGLEAKRKENKEFFKSAASEMKKKRTKIKNLAAKCQGDALINYTSDTQLIAVLNGIKGLAALKSMDDEILEKYEAKGFMICGAIRELHSLSKEIGTYGDQWAMEWHTKPCKEEGWLHPGDGRLHCVFNQYDAETGRSSSEKPNGQNLPQDKEVRSCFIADPPDESIRISDCCEADTFSIPEIESDYVYHICTKCENKCKTHAEEHVKITADMSGAELRIIAELAKDPIWCGAFNRGEDVHSVGTEILHEEGWVNVQLRSLLTPDKWFLSTCNPKKGGEVVLEIVKADGKVIQIGPCAYYATRDDNGEIARQKCECPEHAELRNDNKSTNFLLAYGGGPHTLAKRIKKALEKAQELMALHAAKFPRIWAYLEKSGKDAGMYGRSFDMFGRRRLFPEPTWERARELYKEDHEVKLRLDEIVSFQKVELFKQTTGREPSENELWDLTHETLNTDQHKKGISKTLFGMKGSIERQGKNHAIQGTNASIIKLAMGAGFDKDGKPYLWHTLPKYKAKLEKMVHDELVIGCPKRYAEIVVGLLGDAFKRAAATKMKLVVMEFDAKISNHWEK